MEPPGPLRLLREGRETLARGWSEPERVEFPQPIGCRLRYLTTETADCEVLAREFGARQAEFKASSEFAWLNRSLTAAAQLRARTGFPRLELWADLMRHFVKLPGRFGTDAGGVVVEVTGIRDGVAVQQQIALVAESNGEHIPALPAAIVTGALLRGELTAGGAIALSRCLTSKELFAELRKRGLVFWWKADDRAGWRLLDEVAEAQPQ